jgi:GT2 family glycosyltransferase
MKKLLKKTVKNILIKLRLFSFVENIYNKKETISNVYVYREPTLYKWIKNKINRFSLNPLVSLIVYIHDEDIKDIKVSIESLDKQWYSNWELYIVSSEDSNLVDFLKFVKNPKISLKFINNKTDDFNFYEQSRSLANGQYVGFISVGDVLTKDALYEIIKFINNKNAEFIYSDEDYISKKGVFYKPQFKPDYTSDLFLSCNYINNLTIIKRDLIDKVDSFSHRYEMYLKVLEHTNKVAHISKILYHNKEIAEVIKVDHEVKFLEDAIKRRNIKANISSGIIAGTHKINYDIIDNILVSIIIPFKDQPKLLKMCIESILQKSTYKNFEIIGISNNSVEKETFDEMKRLMLEDKRIKFYEYNVSFNYSKINNYALQFCNGEHLLFLNNDTKVISPKWIEELLMHSLRSEIGVVGAKLYFPDDSIQHAGVILGKGEWHNLGYGVAGHAYSFFKEDFNYDPMRMLNNVTNYHAVTAACMMVDKKLFEKVGGFNEVDLTIAFNDVDLCLRIEDLGLNNLYTPYAKLYHYESISRGNDAVDEEKQKRYTKEVNYMFDNYLKRLTNDKYFNKNLSLTQDVYFKLEDIKC